MIMLRRIVYTIFVVFCIPAMVVYWVVVLSHSHMFRDQFPHA
jgi:hypothetical protein